MNYTKKIISLCLLVAFTMSLIGVDYILASPSKETLRPDTTAKDKELTRELAARFTEGDRPNQGEQLEQKIENSTSPPQHPPTITAESLGEKKAILEGRVEASFWLGGRGSKLYKSLNPKAELAVRPGKDVREALRELQEEKELDDQDIVLLYWHAEPAIIRLRVAPLERLLKTNWVRMPIDSFAYFATRKLKAEAPYVFEQTIGICEEDSRIDIYALYVDPSRRERGKIIELVNIQRKIAEQHFRGYEITTKTPNIFVMRTFSDCYGADLDFDECKRSASTAIYTLRGLFLLGLIDRSEVERLRQAAPKDETHIPAELLYNMLRENFAPLGNGNTLKGILKGLTKIKRERYGRSGNWTHVQDGLDRCDGWFYLKGIVGYKDKAPAPKAHDMLDFTKSPARFTEQDGERELAIAALVAEGAGDSDTLVSAVRTVAGYDDQEALRLLLRCLAHRSAHVQHEAMSSFVRKGVAVAPHLNEALISSYEPDTPKPERIDDFRYRLAEALGYIGDPSSLEALKRAAVGRNANVALFAAEALTMLRREREIAQEIVQFMRGHLLTPSSKHVHAAYTLARFEDDGYEAMEEIFKDKSNHSSVRMKAAWGMVQACNVRAKESFEDVLDGEWDIEAERLDELMKIRRALHKAEIDRPSLAEIVNFAFYLQNFRRRLADDDGIDPDLVMEYVKAAFKRRTELGMTIDATTEQVFKELLIEEEGVEYHEVDLVKSLVEHLNEMASDEYNRKQTVVTWLRNKQDRGISTAVVFSPENESERVEVPIEPVIDHVLGSIWFKERTENDTDSERPIVEVPEISLDKWRLFVCRARFTEQNDNEKIERAREAEARFSESNSSGQDHLKTGERMHSTTKARRLFAAEEFLPTGIVREGFLEPGLMVIVDETICKEILRLLSKYDAMGIISTAVYINRDDTHNKESFEYLEKEFGRPFQRVVVVGGIDIDWIILHEILHDCIALSSKKYPDKFRRLLEVIYETSKDNRHFGSAYTSLSHAIVVNDMVLLASGLRSFVPEFFSGQCVKGGGDSQAYVYLKYLMPDEARQLFYDLGFIWPLPFPNNEPPSIKVPREENETRFSEIKGKVNPLDVEYGPFASIERSEQRLAGERPRFTEQDGAQPIRILLVEDDGDQRERLVRGFTKEGYKVIETVNPQDALRKLDELEILPHLMVADLNMLDEETGKIDSEAGPKLAKEVRKRYPQIKTILTSMGMDGAEAERYRELEGIDEACNKVTELLVSKIKGLLSRFAESLFGDFKNLSTGLIIESPLGENILPALQDLELPKGTTIAITGDTAHLKGDVDILNAALGYELVILCETIEQAAEELRRRGLILIRLIATELRTLPAFIDEIHYITEETLQLLEELKSHKETKTGA